MSMRRYAVLGMLLFSGIGTNAYAQEDAPGVATSIKAGTLGAGLELDYAFNANWNIRLQAHAFNYDDDFDEDGIEYSGEIDLSSYGVVVDWRPFSGVFKLSGGFFANSNAVTAKATSGQNSVFDIGDEAYGASGSNPLTLDANIDLGNSSAGYLGLGWGNSYSSGFSFSLDVGVLFSGAPKVSLAANGTAYLVSDPSTTFDVNGNSEQAVELRQQLETERKNLEDDLTDFEYYPVIMLGLGYRF